MTNNIGGWDDYIKTFLKVENVTGRDQKFVIVGLDEDTRDLEQKKLILQLQNEQMTYYFQCNKTNATFLKNMVAIPRQLIGKAIYFDKMSVRNPQTNTMQPGLIIVKIE